MSEKKVTKKPTAKKKDKAEDRDSLGIQKKDYPIYIAVAILVLNVLAFSSDSSSAFKSLPFKLIAIGIDFAIGYILYTKYIAQYMPKRGAKKEPAKTTSKAATPSAETERDKRGLFGIKTKHYPLLAGAILLLINASAFLNGPREFMIVAILVDLVIAGYFAYRKYGLPWRRH